MSNSQYSGAPQLTFLQAQPLILRYESSNNYQAQNPTSTASGGYQMINSTWLGAAQSSGVNTSLYPTAGSAPAAVQDQVAETLYNQGGIQPWVSNQPLMSAYQQAQAQNTTGNTSTSDSNPLPSEDDTGFDVSNPPTSYDAMGNPVPTMTVVGTNAQGQAALVPTAAPNASSAVAGPGQSLLPSLPNWGEWFTRGVIAIAGLGMVIVGLASFKNNALTLTPSGIAGAARKTIK